MKKKLSVIGEATDKSDEVLPEKHRWLIELSKDGVPQLTIYVKPSSGLAQGGERWGSWVKFATWESKHLANMVHGYKGTVLRKYFIQHDYAYDTTRGERLYTSQAKAKEFVEFWEALHANTPQAQPAQPAQPSPPAKSDAKLRTALRESFFKNLIREAERSGKVNLFAYTGENLDDIRLFTGNPDLDAADFIAEVEEFMLSQIAAGILSGSVDRDLHIFNAGPAAPAPYNPKTVAGYEALASATGGKSFYAPDAATLPGTILEALDAGLVGLRKGETVDLALIVDTTSSMTDDIDAVKGELNRLIDHLHAIVAGGSPLRVGVVLYRDFGDEYLNRVFPFSPDLEDARNIINAITVGGGGDEPEAVYDALHAAFTELEWKAKKRMGILIGDAPPHAASPEGHTLETIAAEAAGAGVNVNLYPIIVGL